MKYTIAKLVFWISGWKLDATPELKKKSLNTVTIAAPHTSNWDIVYSLGAFWLMRMPVKFLIKDFYMNWYFFGFFKWLGGIGVNRKQRSNLVETSAQILRDTNFNLMISPEGTRKRVDQWRMGFYHIAKQANVDISLGYLDYSKKSAGLLDVVAVGELEATLNQIQELYKEVQGKQPELYNPNIY